VHRSPPRRAPPDPVRPRIARASGAPSGDQLVLERYALLERLGAGGFGEVWRARDELLHRDVALKRIHLGPGCDGERAEREALAAARLAHPAIVALYEACAREDAFYLISELVEGCTLAELIADDALEDEEILEIGLALGSALTHAHARGVIHRDIKPQNVLVPDDAGDAAPAAKLTDFGGASLVDEEALTRTGDVLGTLAYMAPEQSEGREAGAPADLYALALLLYEALSGENPVRGATPAATARRIGSPIPSLARRRRDLDRSLVRSLDRALSPDPRARGSVEELEESLAAALDGTPAAGGRRRREPASPRIAPTLPAAPAWEGAAPPRRPATASPAPEAVAIAPGPPPAPRERRLPGPTSASADQGRGLPRIAWIGLGLAVAAWQLIAGRPGAALLVVLATAPLLALPRRSGPGWMAAALAPALGAVGLAGAYPAVASQAARWRERALLGALGYWWLTLAEPLLGRTLWLGMRPGTPSAHAWEPSLQAASDHVVGPLLNVTVLLGAALWALAAAIEPLLVRGRSAAADIVAATVWSAALVATVPQLAAGHASYGAHPSPRGAVLGAVVGGIVAVAARALRGPVRPKGA